MWHVPGTCQACNLAGHVKCFAYNYRNSAPLRPELFPPVSTHLQGSFHRLFFWRTGASEHQFQALFIPIVLVIVWVHIKPHRQASRSRTVKQHRAPSPSTINPHHEEPPSAIVQDYQSPPSSSSNYPCNISPRSAIKYFCQALPNHIVKYHPESSSRITKLHDKV